MPFFYRERRGLEWKQGWVEQTLSSVSLPPLPLLTIFAIVLLFLSLSHYSDYKGKMEQSVINFKLFLFLVPVSLIFITRYVIVNGKITFQIPRVGHDSIRQARSLPWGVAFFVVLLLAMISYKSSFESQWF